MDGTFAVIVTHDQVKFFQIKKHLTFEGVESPYY